MTKPLDIENLKFKYRDKWILSGISLDVQEKGITGIIGPNGSGKSTLIKNIAGVLNEQEGVISILDKQKKAYSTIDLAKIMGVVHQKNNIDYDFSVRDIVMMGRNPHIGRFHKAGPKDHKIVDEAIQATDLDHLKDKSVLHISGGEMQRAIIARTLAQQPKLLLLDEPISHLDIGHQLEMMKLLKQLSHEYGLTIVVVLHELNIAMNYCDSLVLLHSGEIFSTGKPDEVINENSLQKVYGVNGKVQKDAERENFTIIYEY